ncbi:DivIVA domain-containing protein [Streptomyces sp. NPDC007205]|uniref:DivIVA domain-containing protein n=1 Tax=Streptomyces sp. NPDC007205 TaxID=3154316 RepID=UPI0034116212
MPLTPEDVRNKQFTTTRLREGYDEDEVDSFLDKVEAELTRLLRENKDLRAKLAAATGPNAKNQQNADQPPEQDQQQSMRAPSALPAGIPGPPQQTGGPSQLPMSVPQLAGTRDQGGSQGSSPMGQGAGDPSGDSAARVLSLAQQTADQAIAEARSEANKILGEARIRAEDIERDASARADALERDAQDKHRAVIGSLESARATLERKIEDLRGFERDYRSRLKSYLESQLRHLELQDDAPPPPPPPPPHSQAASSLPPSITPSGVGNSHRGNQAMGDNPPPYGGQQHMSATMPPPMSQGRRQEASPMGQAPLKSHGFLIEEDDD